MPLFKKKSVDVIDLTRLQKQGILKTNDAEDNYPEYNTETITPESNPLGFLDNLANSNPTQTFSTETEEPKQEPPELNNLGIKLEDLEYKLERFLERLEKIENKIGDFERKVLNN